MSPWFRYAAGLERFERETERTDKTDQPRLGMVALIVASAVFWEVTSEEVPPTEEEAHLVVRIEQLANHLEGFEPDLSEATFTKTQYVVTLFSKSRHPAMALCHFQLP